MPITYWNYLLNFRKIYKCLEYFIRAIENKYFAEPYKYVQAIKIKK